jgi:hypothetical protein
VYVAGWGKQSDHKCTTDAMGPSSNMKCKFPFQFKFFTFSGCSKLASPSSYEEICSKLKAIKCDLTSVPLSHLLHEYYFN